MDEPVEVERVVFDSFAVPEIDESLSGELQELRRMLADKLHGDALILANVSGFAQPFVFFELARIHAGMVASPAHAVAVTEVAHVQLETEVAADERQSVID